MEMEIESRILARGWFYNGKGDPTGYAYDYDRKYTCADENRAVCRVPMFSAYAMPLPLYRTQPCFFLALALPKTPQPGQVDPTVQCFLSMHLKHSQGSYGKVHNFRKRSCATNTSFEDMGVWAYFKCI